LEIVGEGFLEAGAIRFSHPPASKQSY